MLNLYITSVAAIFTAIVFLVQTFLVIRERMRLKIILGDGDEDQLRYAIRGHANTAEQAPLFLILLALGEAQMANVAILWLAAGVFMIGRLTHFSHFAGLTRSLNMRRLGMSLSLLGTIISVFGLIVVTL